MNIRGSGRTTEQLKALPIRGYFIVGNHSMRCHTKRLADMMGRSDIKILTVNQCGNGDMFKGLNDFTFAIDHATDEVIERDGNARLWESTKALMHQLATIRAA